MNIVNDCKVSLIDHMGSDLTPVNAARVSFENESYFLLTEDGPILRSQDERLINFLARENHISPFFHAIAQFRIDAPIFVARQLAKHTIGFAWNEVSRRYVQSDPSFYVPRKHRTKNPDKKQGSFEDKFITHIYANGGHISLNDFVLIKMQDDFNFYKKLLEAGVCPEQARIYLPQNMMTSWYWTGSLYAWARMFSLRSEKTTQVETRQVAELISNDMIKIFPKSWEALIS